MTTVAPPPATVPALQAILARPGVAAVMELLNAGDQEARIIGGAVRDTLMHRQAADIDIATTATPDEVLALAKSARLHAVATGYEHGTVTLVVQGIPHEVTTLREDIETDGRYARVRYGHDFKTDALRRDFTINAVSLDRHGKLHDYAGGVADMQAQTVRFIGDADQRIREDYLRILRFFRFSASYGDGRTEAEGYAASQRNRDGIARLSRERIRQEMRKLIVAPQALPVLDAMAKSGVLARVLAGDLDLPRLTAMVALDMRHGLPVDALRRFAALALKGADMIPVLQKELCLTRREVAHFVALTAAGPMPIGDAAALQCAVFRLGPDVYRDAVLLTAAESGADATAALAIPVQAPPPDYALTGKDVIALGIAPGPEVTRLLALSLDDWLAAGLPADIADQRRLMARTVRNGSDLDATP